uniref:Uncharacterized protein n=1 Tax=Glossina palpalis gambiensis TaxID=67801 RepID=A0A1B0AX64_9MUSC
MTSNGERKEGIFGTTEKDHTNHEGEAISILNAPSEGFCLGGFHPYSGPQYYPTITCFSLYKTAKMINNKDHMSITPNRTMFFVDREKLRECIQNLRCTVIYVDDTILRVSDALLFSTL